MSRSFHLQPGAAALVRSSFDRVLPHADDFAARFYERLWSEHPELRALFAATDMKRQRVMLVKTLGFALGSLDWLAEITPALEDLGRRHVRYGVQPSDYHAVGEALLWALENTLGDAFTDEARGAWSNVYAGLAAVMIGASTAA